MKLKCSEHTFCSALKKRVQRTYKGNLKGFIKNDYANTSAIITYSMGEGDKGLALNFCPFCGFSFYDLYQAGKKLDILEFDDLEEGEYK